MVSSSRLLMIGPPNRLDPLLALGAPMDAAPDVLLPMFALLNSVVIAL